MTKLLIFKEKLKQIYSRNSIYINPAIRFIVTFIALLVMNHYVGYVSILKNPIVALLIAAMCSLLPVNVIAIVVSIIMTIHMYSFSAELALIEIMLLLIMYIFYFRFTSKYGYILLVMPILFFFKIPYIMPLIIGVALTPSAAVAMIFGTLIYYIMKYTSEDAVTVVNRNADSGIDRAGSLLDNLVKNKEMILIILVFVLAAMLVYGIKKLSIDYSTTIGIVTGGIVELIIIICATYILEIKGMDPVWLIGICTFISTGLVYVLQFFILVVDYTRTEYTQFEDDDYYYYVKAVPKIKVTASDVKIKHINVKKAK